MPGMKDGIRITALILVILVGHVSQGKIAHALPDSEMATALVSPVAVKVTPMTDAGAFAASD